MLEGALLTCKPRLDHDSVTVSQGAEVTHAYLFIRYFCSLLGDKQAPGFWQELGDAEQRLQSVNMEWGGPENSLPEAFREWAEKASEDLKWILINLGILLNF